MSFKLRGGSEGEPEANKVGAFFQPGVKFTKLQVKKHYQLVILPAFDRSIGEDQPGFKRSFIPYRDKSKMDDEQVAEGQTAALFTDWYYLLKGYDFLGNTQFGYLSPLNTKDPTLPNRGLDPMLDIANYAKNSYNPQWNALSEKPKNVKENFSAQAPFPKTFSFMNAYIETGTREKTWEVHVVQGTKATLDDLKPKLNRLASRGETTILDPNWPDYLLGDVTSPYNALVADATVGVFGPANFQAVLLNYSKSLDRLVGHRPWPYDPASAFGISLLEGRYQMEKAVRIMDGQEILDRIVQDGWLPYQLVNEACSNTWVMPQQPVKRTVFVGAAHAGTATAPRIFWTHVNGQVVEYNETQLQEYVQTLGPAGEVLVVPKVNPTNAGWLSSKAYGIQYCAPQPVAPPPQPPAAPVVPQPPAPPAAPQSPAPPAQSTPPGQPPFRTSTPGMPPGASPAGPAGFPPFAPTRPAATGLPPTGPAGFPPAPPAAPPVPGLPPVTSPPSAPPSAPSGGPSGYPPQGMPAAGGPPPPPNAQMGVASISEAPLSAAETAELQTLKDQFQRDVSSLSAESLQRLMKLAERSSRGVS